MFINWIIVDITGVTSCFSVIMDQYDIQGVHLFCYAALYIFHGFNLDECNANRFYSLSLSFGSVFFFFCTNFQWVSMKQRCNLDIGVFTLCTYTHGRQNIKNYNDMSNNNNNSNNRITWSFRISPINLLASTWASRMNVKKMNQTRTINALIYYINKTIHDIKMAINTITLAISLQHCNKRQTCASSGVSTVFLFSVASGSWCGHNTNSNR